jgi:predicted nucleotidyltransferase
MFDKKTKAELIDLAKKYNLSLFILFGSRASNTHKKTSDYDFAFYKDKTISLKNEQNIFEEIMTILKYEKVDIININTNHSHYLRNEIFSKGICIYENQEGKFNEFKQRAWFDYKDFEKYYKAHSEVLKRKISLI